MHQSSAEKSLELHGRELEPDQPMSVLLSNPERKKERTDHDANEREIYVAGLSKFTIKADLEKLFNTVSKIVLSPMPGLIFMSTHSVWWLERGKNGDRKRRELQRVCFY